MDNRETDAVFEYTGVGCSVPKDITSVRFNEGLQKIEHYAFYNCKSLVSITLPSTLVEIGTNAFYGCNNLREVIFNDGMQKIDLYTFCNCSSLESIKFPSTLVEIGSDAFRGCRNLRVIILNNGLQKIDDYTFFNCKSLASITLPSTLVEIGHNAFRGCRNLREVELNGVPQYVKSNAFHNCGALERFLFPNILYRLGNIIQTRHWEDFEDKVNEVRGVVQWESDKLFVSRAIHHNWDETKRDLGKITRLVSYYELKEATSTFELVLWKLNLDQADATNTANRSAYRIDVPGPVKDTMLQYLDHI